MENKNTNNNNNNNNILCILYNSTEFRKKILDFIGTWINTAGLNSRRGVAEIIRNRDGYKTEPYTNNFFKGCMYGRKYENNTNYKNLLIPTTNHGVNHLEFVITLTEEGKEEVRKIIKNSVGAEIGQKINIEMEINFIIGDTGKNFFIFDKNINAGFFYEANVNIKEKFSGAHHVFRVEANSTVSFSEESRTKGGCEQIENFLKFLSLLFIFMASSVSGMFIETLEPYLKAALSDEKYIFLSHNYFLQIMFLYSTVRKSFNNEKFKQLSQNAMFFGFLNRDDWFGSEDAFYYDITEYTKLGSIKSTKKGSQVFIDIVVSIAVNTQGGVDPLITGYKNGIADFLDNNYGVIHIDFPLRMYMNLFPENNTWSAKILDIQKRKEPKINKTGDFTQIIFVGKIDNLPTKNNDVFYTNTISDIKNLEEGLEFNLVRIHEKIEEGIKKKKYFGKEIKIEWRSGEESINKFIEWFTKDIIDTIDISISL